ncbi:hypothetical protein CFO_g3760 [Ceratocystis platani]|uniref:Uncharacterized protein n=1 Tax=Ceratocystis fimbriata f. sp. platani TaxID=88771 RepID=A0A0F8DCZ4_CERFI|nr:hypothetical protein CFO_g3760 [Ceratocystis platani]
MSSVSGHSSRRPRKFALRPPHKARSLNDDASVSDSINSDDQIFASGSSDTTSNMDDAVSVSVSMSNHNKTGMASGYHLDFLFDFVFLLEAAEPTAV